MALKDEPTRIHHILGTIAFISFLVLVVLDALPRYDVSITLAGMLVTLILILLGFGALVTRIIELKYD